MHFPGRNSVRLFLMPGFDLFTRRRVRLVKYWHTGPRRVLDAGFGNGWFSYLAYRSGATVVAVSNEISQVEKAKAFYNGWLGIPAERLSFQLMRFHDLDQLGSNSFEEIICYEALEHVIEDQKVCRSFHDLLVPGGALHLCCPNAEHPRWVAEPLDHKSQWGGHVRAGYTVRTFCSLAEPLGFKLTQVDGMGGPALSAADQVLQVIRGKIGDGLASPIAFALLPLATFDKCPAVPYSIFVRFRKD
jgi:SAM-dependent methyltransferase